MSTFPATIVNFTRADVSATITASLLNDIQIILENIQTKIGIDNTSDINTIDYNLKSGDSPGHLHTIIKVDAETTATNSGIRTKIDSGDSSISVGDVLCIYSDGDVERADGNDLARMPVVTAALEVGSGSAKKCLEHGSLHSSSYNWTVGSPIYMSPTIGDMTQARPTASGDFVQMVGVPTTASVVFFNFNPLIIKVA